MTPDIDDHAMRFDRKASQYDDRDRPIYQACCEIVRDSIEPRADDVVVDLGAGTGAIGLSVAPAVKKVILRDISEGMLEQARGKAASQGQANVDIDQGRFLAPNYDGPATVVTSNFAMHHLDDVDKRVAIGRIAQYQPRRFVLGDVMLFGDSDPADPAYDPSVDDPATVGHLTAAMTAAGFELRRVEPVTDQAGVIVAEQPRDGWEP